MKFAIKIGVVLFVFLSPSVLNVLGLSFISTYIIFFIAFLALLKFMDLAFHKKITAYKIELTIISVAFCYAAIRFSVMDFQAIRQSVFFLVIPMLLSIHYQCINLKTRDFLRKIILLFYTSECLLAVYEQLNKKVFFPLLQVIDGDNTFFETSGNIDFQFRSNAFLGHPLLNALITSIILSFILISSISIRNKLFYYTIGLLALLSFNARGALIIWSFLSLYFLVVYIRANKYKSSKILLILFFYVLLFFGLGYLILNFGFGDRLIMGEVLDASAMSRFSVLNVFDFIPELDFWIGNSNNVKLAMNKINAAGIENGFIVVIINYGIIISTVLFCLYMIWLKKLFKTLDNWKVTFILIGFIVVGSTNNSLAAFVTWVFFIIVYAAFLPIIQRDK